MPFDQADEHLHDLLMGLFPGSDLVGGEFAFGHEDIETSRAFEGRPVRDVKETAAIFGRVLAVALGNIERDRRGRSVQLFLDIAQTHLTFQEAGDPCDKRDRFAIDIQPLVIKPIFRLCAHRV